MNTAELPKATYRELLRTIEGLSDHWVKTQYGLARIEIEERAAAETAEESANFGIDTIRENAADLQAKAQAEEARASRAEQLVHAVRIKEAELASWSDGRFDRFSPETVKADLEKAAETLANAYVDFPKSHPSQYNFANLNAYITQYNSAKAIADVAARVRAGVKVRIAEAEASLAAARKALAEI